MAIAYRDYAQVFGTTTSTNITIPATVQVGDMLIMQAVGGWYPTPPSGWTVDYSNPSSSNVRAFVAYRVAQAGDAGSTINIAWSNAYNHVINLIAVSGSTTFRTPTIHNHSSAGGSATLGPTGGATGDFVIYMGGNRQDGGVPTLSRGTTVVSANDGSTVVGGFIAYDSVSSNGLFVNMLTAPSEGNGYLYSLMVLSDGGTAVNYNVVSSNYLETLYAASASAQVSSNYVESLLVGQSSAQISSNYLEVLHASALAQIETVYSEALINSTMDARIEAVYTEALISSPRLQAESVYAEILDSGTPNIRAESVYAEVLNGGAPNIQAEMVYAEVLVSLTVFNNKRGWGITSI